MATIDYLINAFRNFNILFAHTENTAVSYKMDVNSKLMLQVMRKSAVKDNRPKKKV